MAREAMSLKGVGDSWSRDGCVQSLGLRKPTLQSVFLGFEALSRKDIAWVAVRRAPGGRILDGSLRFRDTKDRAAWRRTGRICFGFRATRPPDTQANRMEPVTSGALACDLKGRSYAKFRALPR
jgi:hypothetical protein